jgi:hypothetical protein
LAPSIIIVVDGAIAIEADVIPMSIHVILIAKLVILSEAKDLTQLEGLDERRFCK